jgi:hypothetical protein
VGCRYPFSGTAGFKIGGKNVLEENFAKRKEKVEHD